MTSTTGVFASFQKLKGPMLGVRRATRLLEPILHSVSLLFQERFEGSLSSAIYALWAGYGNDFFVHFLALICCRALAVHFTRYGVLFEKEPL